MATKQEEKDEQDFFAGKVKEQEKEDKMATKHEDKHAKTEPETEEFRDSLGQLNPAHAMEVKNLKEASERAEKAEKDAEKAEPKGA